MEVKFIEPVQFLYMLTVCLNVPIEKQLIYHKVCLRHYNQTFCDSDFKNGDSGEENVIQAGSAKWNTYLGIAKLIPTILSTIYLGAWSDAVGRKTIITVALVGETLYAISCFVNAWFLSSPVYYLFIGSVLTGICGNVSAFIMGVLAYIGDITSTEARTTRIIMIDGLSLLAAVISLISGGIILEKLGFLYLYAIDVGLYFIAMLYMILLKESYVPSDQIKLMLASCGTKLKMYAQLLKQEANFDRTRFMLYVGCFLCLVFVVNGPEDDIEILYLLHVPLSFTSAGIGYALAAKGCVSVIGAIILGVIVKKFQWMDSSLAFLCSIAILGYSLSLAFSKAKSEVYSSFLWGIGMATGTPACRSALSKMVPVEDLGKLNSIVCVLESISQLVAGIIFNTIYEYTVHITPSLTYFVNSGLCLIPLLLTAIWKVHERRTTPAGHQELA